MIGLTRCRIAGDFGIHPRLPFFCMGHRLKDQRAGSLAHDKPVAATIERARSFVRRLIVFGRQRPEGAEPGKDQRRDTGVRAHRNDDIRSFPVE